MAASRTLQMRFNTQLGKTHTIRVNNAKDPLTGAEVAAAMDSIIASNIFTGTGGDLTSKLDARIEVNDSSDLALI